MIVGSGYYSLRTKQSNDISEAFNNFNHSCGNKSMEGMENTLSEQNYDT